MKWQARFTPNDKSLKPFYHEIIAEDSYKAEAAYNLLASTWGGKFDDMSRIL